MEILNLRTDASKEREGVWVKLDATTEVKVRYTDTLAFNRATRAKFAPFRKNLKAVAGDTVVSDEQGEQITVDLLVDEVLLDWRGITEHGKQVPYSKDKAREYLKMKAFRDMVETAAADIANFRASASEEDAKN